MGCDCVYDNPCKAIFSDEFRTCRKPRKCCECLTMIKQKERYHFLAGVLEDGGAMSFSTCVKCSDLRKRCEFQCAGYEGMAEAASEMRDRDMEVEAFLNRRRRAVADSATTD